MRMTYLVLSDIGPFRGTHSIDLTSDGEKNGFAFFGQNGRGKTTIYNAMKWCLWGEVKTRVRASMGEKIPSKRRPIVGESGRILMNRDAYENDARQEMSVVLLAEGKNGSIQVSRTARSSIALPRSDKQLEIVVNVAIGDATYSGIEAQEQIESFFPRELERFFFIDGEALEEYTDMLEADSTSGLKDEVESVLRLPSLTRGKGDLEFIRTKLLEKVRRKKTGKKKALKADKEARELSRSLDRKNYELGKLNDRLKFIQGTIADLDEKISKNAEIKVLADRLNETRASLSAARESLERSSARRVRELSEAWKILLWRKLGPIYSDYDDQLDMANQATYEIKSLKKNISRRKSEIADFKNTCSECGQTIPDVEIHLQKMRESLENDERDLEKLRASGKMTSEDLFIATARLIKLRPQDGDRERALEAEAEWASDLSRVKNLEEEEDRLSKKVGLEAVSKMGELGSRKGKNELEERNMRVRIEQLKENIRDEEKRLAQLEKMGANVDTAVSTDSKALDEIDRISDAIEKTISEYREKARAEVQEISTEVFMEVTNAKSTFSGIQVDENFRASIMLRSGRPATEPSSGMKSMMTVSIIDALRRVSRLRAPIFFDTPGRSLDEEHKQALLDYFWRDHGEQFLIFAHSGEYQIEKTLEDFGEKIAKSWRLTWPGDHTSCTQCNTDDIRHDERLGEATCNECNYSWDTTIEHSSITQLEVA